MSVLQSQHEEKYHRLEADSNQHIVDMKELHANAIELLERKYNESKGELTKQLMDLGTEM